jgi:hypothetical protein
MMVYPMAKFAPVVPIQIAQFFKERGVLGDYHLVLAHEIVASEQSKKDYKSVYNNSDGRMDVILDNSVAELGTSVDLSIIRTACDIICPVTTVLPDVYLKTDETITSCLNALDSWHMLAPFMIVPQGTSLKDFARCAEVFANQTSINYWGIPRNLTSNLGTRKQAIDVCFALNRHRQIHLLGFSDNVPDDIICAQDPRVFGIDSAVPIRAASLNMQMSFSLDMPPRGNWFKDATPNELMISNLAKTRSWVRAC